MVNENHFEVVSKAIVEGFSTQRMSYLRTSSRAFSAVKADFKLLPEFKQMEALQLDGAAPNVVVVQADDLDTSLLAASYMAKKWKQAIRDVYVNPFAAMNLEKLPPAERDIVKQLAAADEFDEDLYVDLMNVVVESGEHDDWEKEKKELMADGDFGFDFSPEQKVMQLADHELPILTADALMERYLTAGFDFSSDTAQPLLLDKPQTAWYEESSVLIVLLDTLDAEAWAKMLPHIQANLICIVPNGVRGEKIRQQLYFLTELQALQLTSLPPLYLKAVFKTLLAEQGMTLERGFAFQYLLHGVKKLRAEKFNVLQDVIYVANRLCRMAGNDKTVTNAMLHKLMPADVLAPQPSKLSQLVGLEQAKKTFEKIVAKMKYNAARQQQGYEVVSHYNVLLFLGNPGTAKTTFAKYAADYLVQERLLKNDRIAIVSKKDLIAEYVGHTTLKVAELFQQYAGGVIFIDEAYSLYEGDSNQSTVFAEEAMAELVLQIEENPDTMVIFAGYPNEMRAFMERANTGLKSRISHQIHFDDYSPEEMSYIYLQFVQQHQFKLQDAKRQQQCIIQFFRDNAHVRIADGNGRLMRQLFNAIVEEKIMARPADAIITLQHVTSGLQAYVQTVTPPSLKKIGFEL